MKLCPICESVDYKGHLCLPQGPRRLRAVDTPIKPVDKTVRVDIVSTKHVDKPPDVDKAERRRQQQREWIARKRAAKQGA